MKTTVVASAGHGINGELKGSVAASHVVHERRNPMTPNPSIEGMPKRLRLLCTPHVKR
jgi:hypothetical protein